MAANKTVDTVRHSIDGLKATISDARGAPILLETLQTVVELSVLRAFSIVEVFLQDLFYEAVLGTSNQSGVKPVMSLGSEAEVELLLYRFGSRRERYLDWLPFGQTLERARALLVDAAPFSWIEYRRVELRALNELSILRNAIAHPSDYAYERFVHLANEKTYPSGRPGEYLLSARGGELEVLLMLTRIELTATGLAAQDVATADNILEPEEPFFLQQRCPPGLYYCEGCGGQRELQVEQVIGRCDVCGSVSVCPGCHRRTERSPNWRRTFL